jgi:hypothetical protein
MMILPLPLFLSGVLIASSHWLDRESREGEQ